MSKHIGYCYLFPVCCSLLYSCSLLCTAGSLALPFQNDLLQKTEVFANLALENPSNNKNPTTSPKSFLMFFGLQHIGLLRTLPQLEELGSGMDEG